MNLVAWIFYVIGKVLTVPMGSIKEFERSEEDANEWYKKVKETTIGKKLLEQWWFKIALLIIGIVWLIPYLRSRMNPIKKPKTDPEFEEEPYYEIVDEE